MAGIKSTTKLKDLGQQNITDRFKENIDLKKFLCCFILGEQNIQRKVCLRSNLNLELDLTYPPLYHIEFNANQQIFTKAYYVQGYIVLISGESKWSRLVLSNSLWPSWLQPTRLLHPWDFPGKNAGVGCHFLLQEIFPTQGLNPGLPHCRHTLLQSEPPEKILLNLKYNNFTDCLFQLSERNIFLIPLSYRKSDDLYDRSVNLFLPAIFFKVSKLYCTSFLPSWGKVKWLY